MIKIADYNGPDADNNIHVVSGNIFIASGNVALNAGTNYIGQVSGAFSATVESAFIPSGNIYIQSGVNWTGVGSVFAAGGSLNINNPQLIGSLATQGVIGSVAVTNLASKAKTFIVNISGTATDTAASGANFNIYWVKVVDYKGANSIYSGTFAISGTYLKVGSSNDTAIPLWTLARPETDLIWVGKVNGDIYVTHQGGPVGSPLTLLVGTDS